MAEIEEGSRLGTVKVERDHLEDGKNSSEEDFLGVELASSRMNECQEDERGESLLEKLGLVREGNKEGGEVVLGSGVSQLEVEALEDEDLELKIIIRCHINPSSAHESMHGEPFGNFS